MSALRSASGIAVASPTTACSGVPSAGAIDGEERDRAGGHVDGRHLVAIAGQAEGEEPEAAPQLDHGAAGQVGGAVVHGGHARVGAAGRAAAGQLAEGVAVEGEPGVADHRHEGALERVRWDESGGDEVVGDPPGEVVAELARRDAVAQLPVGVERQAGGARHLRSVGTGWRRARLSGRTGSTSAPGRRDGQRRRRVGAPIAASPTACVGLWIARPIEWGGAVRPRWTDPARTLAACSGWRGSPCGSTICAPPRPLSRGSGSTPRACSPQTGWATAPGWRAAIPYWPRGGRATTRWPPRSGRPPPPRSPRWERSRRSWRAPPTATSPPNTTPRGRLSTQPKGAAGGAKDRPGPPAQPPFGRDGTGPPPPAGAGGPGGPAGGSGPLSEGADGGRPRRHGRTERPRQRLADGCGRMPAARRRRRPAGRGQRAGRRPARARAGRRCPTPSPRTTPAASPSGCGRRRRGGSRWRRG